MEPSPRPVTLTAGDEGRGGWKTVYRVNDGPATEGDKVVIEEEGTHLIRNYSIDHAVSRESGETESGYD